MLNVLRKAECKIIHRVLNCVKIRKTKKNIARKCTKAFIAVFS